MRAAGIHRADGMAGGARLRGRGAAAARSRQDRRDRTTRTRAAAPTRTSARPGLNTAASIAAAIDYMIHQPFIRKNGVIAIGQSAGGWGALALASQNYPPLKAVIAFAPGRGGRIDGEAGRNCAPDRLVAAARQFGEKTRIPSLWLYAENDSYFPPGAVEAAGGRISAGRRPRRIPSAAAGRQRRPRSDPLRAKEWRCGRRSWRSSSMSAR